jgi:hypothetical protein
VLPPTRADHIDMFEDRFGLQLKEALVRQIAYISAAAITLAGVVAYMGIRPSWAVAENTSARENTLPPGYRDWRLIADASNSAAPCTRNTRRSASLPRDRVRYA